MPVAWSSSWAACVGRCTLTWLSPILQVLGVVALCTDSLSADDFLPAMASVLPRAALRRIASDVSSVTNFAWRLGLGVGVGLTLTLTLALALALTLTLSLTR